MFVDKFNNVIHVVSEESYSMTILGKPGSGKTYSNYRHIEDSIRDGIAVLIVDFSGSYTEYEMERAELDKSLAVDIKNPYKGVVNLVSGETLEVAVENLSSSLCEALGIQAMTQRELLLNISEKLMQANGYVTFHDVYEMLQEFSETEEDSRYLENIDILKRRFFHMKKMHSLHVTYGMIPQMQGITILQISDYTEDICRTIAQFILELEWCNNRTKHKSNKCLEIIIDEFQLLRVNDTGIEKLVRLGRKNGVGVVLLSQYMPNTEDKKIIQLAENNLYFKPNDSDIVSTAKIIKFEKYREWIPILKSLKRGEAVLTGKYTVNDNKKVLNEPIVISVISKQED